ncbi:MAG: type III pantothenate kinase [Candidatus Obscuribacterales bacterium]|nr:type III pantothenate kinase [Candidatus Obscuribacterales bacterium]
MTELLVIDVGNSNVKYALFKEGKLEESWRHTLAEATAQVPATLAKSKAPIILSSVVPSITDVIKKSAGARQLLEISASSQPWLTGMDATMGGDRVADAVGAWKLYGNGKPVVIMGFGTATTLLAISAKGHVEGGWIAPGLNPTLQSLHEHCELLPLLEMTDQSQALGVDTNTHMRNGVFIGHIGLAKEWIAVASKLLGAEPVKVATGGWAETIHAESKIFDHVDQNLTLNGIRLIGEELLTGKSA